MVCYAEPQTTLLADVPCNKLLVWLKVSGFWYAINIAPPRKLWDVLLLQAWRSCNSVSADWSLHRLQQLIGGADIGVDQLKALNMGLDSSWVGQFRPPLGQTLPPRVRTSYPACIARNGDSSPVAAVSVGTAVCWQPLKVRASSAIHRPVGPVLGEPFPTEAVRGRTRSQVPSPWETYENILKNKT